MQVVDRKVQHGKKVLVGPGFVPTILGLNDSRSRLSSYQLSHGDLTKLNQKISYIYPLRIIPDPFPFPIPLPAWREFHFTSPVLSTYPKGPSRAEKSSIFNFGYVKEVCFSGLLGVKIVIL
jgi:hypothetical protein